MPLIFHNTLKHILYNTHGIVILTLFIPFSNNSSQYYFCRMLYVRKSFFLGFDHIVPFKSSTHSGLVKNYVTGVLKREYCNKIHKRKEEN